uniref:Exostosin GT47 domain-containing protein n=1 Tax=Eutreptiella gymnastica TaxID=73025 RepID=A0A7S4GJB1_9EUGL
MVPLILVVMALAGLGLYQLKASQKPAPTLLTNEKERFHEPVLAPGDRDLWNSSNAATPNVPPRALPAAVAPIVQPVSVSPAPPSPVSVQSPVSVAPAPPSATETASKIPRAGARQGPGPRLEPLASHSSAQAVVERCLEDTSATCSYTDDCPPMDRECLRAFIPFGTPYERVVCCFRCCMRWAKREFFTFNQQACSVPVRRCRHRIVPELETPVLLSHTMVSRFADYQFCGFGFCGDWANAWDFPSMKRTPVRRSGFISVHTHSPSMKPFTQCILPKLQFPVMVHSPGGSRWPTMPAIQRHRHTHGLFDALPDVGPPRDFSQVTPEGVAARQPLPFRYSKVHFMPIGVLAPVRIHNQLMAAAANGTAAGTGKSRLLLCRGMTDRKTDTGSRQAKMKVLNRNGFKECQVNTNVPELFRVMADADFVASPAGDDFQNFRDTEAVISGAIILVDYQPWLHELRQGMPVVEVRNWRDVTKEWLEERLAEMRRKIRKREVSLTKAYLPHWLYELSATSAVPAENLTYPSVTEGCSPKDIAALNYGPLRRHWKPMECDGKGKWGNETWDN